MSNIGGFNFKQPKQPKVPKPPNPKAPPGRTKGFFETLSKSPVGRAASGMMVASQVENIGRDIAQQASASKSAFNQYDGVLNNPMINVPKSGDGNMTSYKNMNKFASYNNERTPNEFHYNDKGPYKPGPTRAEQLGLVDIGQKQYEARQNQMLSKRSKNALGAAGVALGASMLASQSATKPFGYMKDMAVQFPGVAMDAVPGVKQMKQNWRKVRRTARNLNKTAMEEIDELYMEKAAGSKVKDMFVEDFVRPGVEAIPYYAAPAAVAYGVNKYNSNLEKRKQEREQQQQKLASYKPWGEWAREDLPKQAVRGLGRTVIPAAFFGGVGALNVAKDKKKFEQEVANKPKSTRRKVVEQYNAPDPVKYDLGDTIEGAIRNKVASEIPQHSFKDNGWYPDTFKGATDRLERVYDENKKLKSLGHIELIEGRKKQYRMQSQDR